MKPIHYKKLVKVAEKSGCKFIRQKGSHLVYWKDGLNRPVIIPTYDEVPVFIIKRILNTLKVTEKEYQRLIGK